MSLYSCQIDLKVKMSILGINYIDIISLKYNSIKKQNYKRTGNIQAYI